MEQFKKYVTCMMTFFIQFICVTLCQFYSATSPVLFTKNEKLWNERKEYFFNIWLLQRTALYEHFISQHSSIISPALSKELLDIQATIECRFTLKRVRDMIITYSQIHRTDKYSQHSSIIWPIWLNG